jgi:GDP-L-fucose synthase
MNPESRIFVAGPGTLIGSALVRRLGEQGFTHLVGATDGPDLLDAHAVDRFFAAERPEYVFVAAGRSGGIDANQKYPADLMLENLLVAAHLVPAAWTHGAAKLLYLTSSCTYPKHAPPPMRPESLWTGELEPTSAAYATAKLAGARLCDAYRHQHGARFIVGIPADAFGPGDDFSPESSHVVAALIRRMHDARERGDTALDVWGSGAPRREFIYADDLADACIAAMLRYEGAAPVNLGTGIGTSIRELAELVRDVVGYRGSLWFDTTRPDGMPCKALDSTVLHGLGWRPARDLRAALASTYEWLQARLETTEETGPTGSPRSREGSTLPVRTKHARP